MAYTLNSSLPSLNLCLSSNGKYRGSVCTPSFDLSQSIKVPLDSIGLISLSKLYMSSPSMLDTNMFMTLRLNVEHYDTILKEWFPETYDMRVNADSNTLFDILRTWVDDVKDISKQTQAWCLMLKYILDGLNSIPPGNPELSTRFSVQVGSAGLFTSGTDFGEGTADVSSLTPEQSNNRAVAESIATFSNKTAYLRLVSELTDPDSTLVRVLSLTFSGSFLKLLNLSPNKAYTLVGGGTENLIPINLGMMNHDYIYVRCSQAKNEWSCMQEGSQLNMSDLLAVVPCNYGKFIYYEKYNTGGKNVLACPVVWTPSIWCLRINGGMFSME